MIGLDTLEISHPLRTMPLRQIKAQMRNRLGTLWREVATWKIGATCYNDLAPFWHEYNEFKAPQLP